MFIYPSNTPILFSSTSEILSSPDDILQKEKAGSPRRLFSISTENDFGEILRKFFLDNRKNLGKTYIFTHSVFIDKSVYSCNNEEDEGEIPPKA